RPTVGFLILWHALVAGLLAVIADMRVVGFMFWSDRVEEFLVSAVLLGAYALVAVITIIAAARGRPMRLSTIITTSLCIFGLAFLGLLLFAPKPLYSRALILSLGIVGFVLLPGAVLPARLRRWVPVVLALGLLGAIGLDTYRTLAPKKPPTMTRTA